MSLEQQIDTDIKQAILAKDADKLRALRQIKALILFEENDNNGHQIRDLSAEDEIRLLTRALTKRKEAAYLYRQQNRSDLLAVEESEIAVIEHYLPKQLSESELKEKIKAIITRVGASSPSDMGKVMVVANRELIGQTDGQAISAMVRQLLA